MARLVPEGDLSRCSKVFRLFDHLVGARKHSSGNFEAKCFGSLEVDDELVFRRCLNRKGGRLLAFEQTIDIRGCLPVLVA